MIYLTFVNVMLDADAVINNSSHKAGGSREKVRAGPAGSARVRSGGPV